MKGSKVPTSGKAISSKKGNVSNMLANETKKMEEKLELVKKMMELEKTKRS